MCIPSLTRRSPHHTLDTEASFGGGGWGERPSKEKEKKEKEKKKEKKKKERKEKKREKRKKGTMNSVKLLHIKCCFFPIFQYSGGIEKYKKNFGPQEKVEMTPLPRYPHTDPSSTEANTDLA